MQSGWCVICGAARRHDFACRQDAPEPGAVPVRYVLCDACGHVYQDPILDTASLQAALGVRLSNPRAFKTDLDDTRIRAFIQWAGRQLGDVSMHRSLLYVGYWPLDDLMSLASDGREIVAFPVMPGLEPSREGSGPPAGEGAAAGIRSRTPPSDRRFSGIVLSALECFPDPIPFLRALRPCLEPGGRLLISTVNVLAPPSSEQLLQELFFGVQARLYSYNALRTILARSGFVVESVEGFSEGAGLGLSARPCEWEADAPHDDPHAVQQLYRAHGWPGSVEPLGWNLAALAEHQPMTLPLLCRQMESGRYLIRRSGRHVVGLIGTTEEGDVVPIARWGTLDGNRALLASMPADESATIVQMGLGSGELAGALAQRLAPSQRLFIWEADPLLARTVLDAVDLSHLWHRADVSLLLGDAPMLTTEQQARLQAPSFVYSTDAARSWNPSTYRHLLGSLNLSETASGTELRLEHAAAGSRA
jgi:hypothetical protein